MVGGARELKFLKGQCRGGIGFLFSYFSVNGKWGIYEAVGLFCFLRCGSLIYNTVIPLYLFLFNKDYDVAVMKPDIATERTKKE